MRESIKKINGGTINIIQYMDKFYSETLEEKAETFGVDLKMLEEYPVDNELKRFLSDVFEELVKDFENAEMRGWVPLDKFANHDYSKTWHVKTNKYNFTYCYGRANQHTEWEKYINKN